MRMEIKSIEFVNGEIEIGVFISAETGKGESFGSFERAYTYDATWTKQMIRSHLQERLNEFKARYDRVQEAQDFVGMELIA